MLQFFQCLLCLLCLYSCTILYSTSMPLFLHYFIVLQFCQCLLCLLCLLCLYACYACNAYIPVLFYIVLQCLYSSTIYSVSIFLMPFMPVMPVMPVCLLCLYALCLYSCTVLYSALMPLFLHYL